MKHKSGWVWLGSVMLLFACVSPGTAQQLRYTTIIAPGSIGTLLTGVNDSGVMVGFEEEPTGAQSGFMLVGKTFTAINDPNTPNTTQCWAINNAGQIVGLYMDAEFVFHAFLYQAGTFTTIDPPGSTAAMATGINNAGEVVGSYNDGIQFHGFLFDGTSYQTLDVPGAEETQWAGGINDSDQVTLQWYDASTKSMQSSVYDGSTYTPITITGAFNTFAYGINKNGNIAITWQDSGLLAHGTVRLQKNGTYYYPAVEAPGSQFDTTWCYGINGSGAMVGYFFVNNKTHPAGFLARTAR